MTHALCGNLRATAPQFIPGARLDRDELVVMWLQPPHDRDATLGAGRLTSTSLRLRVAEIREDRASRGSRRVANRVGDGH